MTITIVDYMHNIFQTHSLFWCQDMGRSAYEVLVVISEGKGTKAKIKLRWYDNNRTDRKEIE
jgi:hypothetical protein